MYQSPEEAYRKGVEAGEQMLAKFTQEHGSKFDGVSGKCPVIFLCPAVEVVKLGFSDYKTLDDDWGIVEGDDVIPFKQDTAALQARLLLIGNRHNPGIIVPNHREWIGFNVLERDGQLEALQPLVTVKQ